MIVVHLSHLMLCHFSHHYCCCSVTKLCLTLCKPMDCSTPGFPVLHYLPEFAQTYAHRVDDSIQLSHPLLPNYPPALNLSNYQDLSHSILLFLSKFMWCISTSGNLHMLLHLSILPLIFQLVGIYSYFWDFSWSSNQNMSQNCSPILQLVFSPS